MISIIDLLLFVGVTPDDIPAGCDKICKNMTTGNIVAFGGDCLSGKGHYLSNTRGETVPKEVITASDFVSAYKFRNLRNAPPSIAPTEVPEHNQTIEQLIAQMDTQADMAKRHTMEHIRLRDLIDNRLNPLGYRLTKK